MLQYLEIIPLLHGRATRPWGGPVRWCSVQWCSMWSAASGSMVVCHAVLRCAACSMWCAVMQPCSVLHVACGTWCAVLQLCSVQGCSVWQRNGAVVRCAACRVQRCSMQPASVAACGVQQRGGTAQHVAVHRCIPTRCPSSPAPWPHPALPATAIHHHRPAGPLPDNEGKSAFSGEPLCCLYKGVWLLTHVR